MLKLLFLFFAITFFSPHLFAQWHELPSPSGGSVNDFCEIAGSKGARIYAATTDGLYRTTDHAQSWQRVGLAYSNVTKVTQYVLDGEEILFAIVQDVQNDELFHLWRTEDSANSWNNIFSSFSMNGVEQDGSDLVLGADSIFRSTDVGGHWTRQAPSPKGDFKNFAILSNHMFGTTVDSGVWEMPSHGNIWERTDFPSSHRAYSIKANGQDLFVGGHLGIDISTNLGVTWLSVPNNGIDTGSNLSEISSFDVNGLTMVATIYDLNPYVILGVFRSTNGGANWEQINGVNGFPKTWSAKTVDFIDDHFFVASDAGVLESTNGINWSYATHGLPARVLDVASNGSTLFATTRRGIFRSNDQGNTWIDPSDGSDLVDSFAVSFTSIGNDLYVLGWIPEGGSAGAGLWKWDGLRWITSTDLPVSSLVSYHGSLYAAAQSYGIIQSSDNGTTWINASSGLPLGSESATVLISTPDRLLAVTELLHTYPKETIYSLDSSGTWYALNSLDTVFGPTGGAYAGGKAYILGYGGGAISTSSDDGVSWSNSFRLAYNIRTAGSQAIVTSPDSIYVLNGNKIDVLLVDSLTGRLNNFGYDLQNGYAATDGRGIWGIPLISLPLAVTPSPNAPASLSLSIFPNPSNGVSTISFRLPQRENISLKLFDERGVKVATYFDGIADPGEVQVPIDVAGLSPGSYIAVLTTREGTAVARVVLLPK